MKAKSHSIFRHQLRGHLLFRNTIHQKYQNKASSNDLLLILNDFLNLYVKLIISTILNNVT